MRSFDRSDTTDVDKACMKKYGHPFLKPYRDGDEHRLFLPMRQFGTFIVYHRYACYKGQRHCHAHPCYCYQNGRICKDCAPLNTTVFYDLHVPIDPERFSEMKHVLMHECRLSMIQIYNWLSFWLHDVFPKRFSYEETTPIFFHYTDTWIYEYTQTSYRFMFLLYDFLKKKTFQKIYIDLRYNHKPAFVVHSRDSVCIRTIMALMKWSLEVYGTDRYITSCQTQMRKYYTVFTTSYDETHDCFSRYWKKMFDVCVSQVRDEVAYRPGMAGMIDAQDDFHARVINTHSYLPSLR